MLPLKVLVRDLTKTARYTKTWHNAPVVPQEGEAVQLRRSLRQRFRPLEYWSGERVVYGPSGDGAPSVCFPSAAVGIPSRLCLCYKWTHR